MKKAILTVLLSGLVAWPSAQVASTQGQVQDVVVVPYVFQDNPNSTFCFTKDLPNITLMETQNQALGGFANRHVWRVSEGVKDNEPPTAKIFQIDDFFELSFDLVLEESPNIPSARRREAGFIVTTAFAGEGQFIIATHPTEVVAFGGPFVFHSFSSQPPFVDYRPGQTIRMGLRYFRDRDGKRKLEYTADNLNDRLPAQSSGPLEVLTVEQGIPGPFTVGGYFQMVIDPGRSDTSGAARFSDIRWNGELLVGGEDQSGCPQPGG